MTFAVYIFFTGLVLVNLLIAMMTNRYDRARRHAQCVCRFNSVAFGLRIGRLIDKIIRRIYDRSDRHIFSSSCYPDPEFRGRYLVEVVERTPPVTSEMEHQRLREDISRLSAEVRDIGDRINDF